MKTIISCYSLVQAHLTKKGLSYYITRLLYKGVKWVLIQTSSNRPCFYKFHRTDRTAWYKAQKEKKERKCNEIT